MNYLLILGVLIFLSSILYTFIAVGKSVGSSDNKKEMASAITNVAIINSIMTLVLGGIAVAYIASNPTAERPYTLIMLHLSLLLSIISVSITTLQKLDSPAVFPSGSGTTGGCPSS